MAMRFYYYQKIDDIGKQIALISSTHKINDTVHYREVDKAYYDAVLELLREQAEADTTEEGEE